MLNSLLATPDQPGSGRIVSMSVASCARWAERLAVWGSPPYSDVALEQFQSLHAVGVRPTHPPRE